MPIIRFLKFEITGPVLEDINQAVANLGGKEWDGLYGVWTGKDLRLPNTGYFVAAWDSVESAKKIDADQSHEELREKHLKTLLANPSTTLDVFEFSSEDVRVAFNSPVTEILVHHLKDGQTKGELDGVLTGLAEHFLGRDAGLRLPRVDGTVIGGDGRFYTAIGWDSYKAYTEASSANTASELIGRLFEIADVKVGLAEFVKRA